MSQPLRYNISDWHRLTEVKSNNSRKLRIDVTDLIQSDILTGMTISVIYKGYPMPLFSYTIGAEGTAVTPNTGVDLTKDQILEELARYGFLVTFNQSRHLPQSMLDYLTTVNNLGYDKLRKITVNSESWGNQYKTTYVVVFSVEKCPEWINNSLEVTEKEFNDALISSGAINLSNIETTNQFDWGWLNFVADIDDIISENQRE